MEGDVIHAEDVEGDEDVETSKVARDPKLPTPEQIEEHNCTHLPFRDWCSFCIMGRGRGSQHKRNQGHQSSVPVVGVDYFFITKGGMKKRDELEQELTPEGESQIDEARSKGELIKCLLVRCFRTKLILAHVVPCKGVDEERWVANLVCDDLLWISKLSASRHESMTQACMEGLSGHPQHLESHPRRLQSMIHNQMEAQKSE